MEDLAHNQVMERLRKVAERFKDPYPTCHECGREKVQTGDNKTDWCDGCAYEKWKARCPSEFLSVDVSKLPNKVAYEKVIAWDRKRSLLLCGKSRTGKTRSLWALAGKLFMSNRAIHVVEPIDLGIRLAAAFGRDMTQAEKMIDRWLQTSYLFLDDPFKAKLTERVQEVLFEIIDFRCARNRPMVLTTNDTGKTLEARMDEDRAAPLIARLREFCDVINFNAP